MSRNQGILGWTEEASDTVFVRLIPNFRYTSHELTGFPGNGLLDMALPSKDVLCRLGTLLLALVAVPAVGFGQTNTPLSSPPDAPLNRPLQEQRNAGEAATYTMQVTTREVVVEVVATGSHGIAITDLKQGEFQVFQVAAHGRKVEQRIAAVHRMDLEQTRTTSATDANDYLVAIGKTCATRTTPYYAVAFHPSAEGGTSGNHEIVVTTSREHIKLAFRHRYYIGVTAPLAAPLYKTAMQADEALKQAACYHGDTPDAFNLSGRMLDTGDIEGVHFSVVISADSLAFTSLSDTPRHAQFDYGICTFNAAGAPLHYLHTDEDRVLTVGQYAQTLSRGFQKLIAFRRSGDPVFARFVVRDRQFGNLGSVGVVIPPVPANLLQPEERATGGAIPVGSAVRLTDENGNGPISSFGLPVPRAGALCGDVYEIPAGSSALPEFWKMEPVGALYTDTLDVQPQHITGTIGIPGVTTRTAWFAIDYWGTFWVTRPGNYAFWMQSDDGSKLYIDEDTVINLDWVHNSANGFATGQVKLEAGPHTIHVPYFQGPPDSVSLVLRVRSPGEADYKPFDVQDFPPQSQATPPGPPRAPR
jgi:hypothetical protein